MDGIAGRSGGRRLFAWVCCIHDIGKSTPAFQHMDSATARPGSGRGWLGWSRAARGRPSRRRDGGARGGRRSLTCNVRRW
ncbi:HD domain-containing protein [Actinomadura darangshiensis]|uniref:HD domain-containing protein n=1 Tax=Actinomadura darangshiensis TaxID=705336 RepID=UPI003C799873